MTFLLTLLTLVLVNILSDTSATLESDSKLEAPDLLSVTGVIPNGIFVEWTLVSHRLCDPVIGYKIRINEIPDRSVTESPLVTTTNQYESYNISLKKSVKPTSKEVTVKGPQTKTIINDIKYNTIYEVSVFAYKRAAIGPPSAPIRIKILKDEAYHAVVAKTRNGCEITVPSGEITIIGEKYPYLYNTYF